MNRDDYKVSILFISLILVLPSFSVFSQPISYDNEQINSKSWTILLYDDADFNYAYDPYDTIINNTGSTDNVNLLILRDREFDPAHIYHINEDNQPIVLEGLGEVNMGDSETLRYFIQYAKSQFPADRYLLTLYNHGGSWKGACWDDTNNSDHLEMNEIQEALQETNGVDIITFSACRMGCIESVYELRHVVDVYIGSEEMHGFGEYWLEIPQILENNKNETTETIAKELIQIYRNKYNYFGKIYDWTLGLIFQKIMGIFPYPPALTISAIKTDGIIELASSIDELSTMLSSDIENYNRILSRIRLRVEDYPRPMKLTSPFGESVDIFQFVKKLGNQNIVKNNLELSSKLEQIKGFLRSVIIDEYHQIGHRRSTGLSIYFPPLFGFSKNYNELYHNCSLDFADDTSWDEFLRTLLYKEGYEENETNVDQSQLKIQSGAVVCDEFTWAQSFIPEKNKLTKVSIPLIKNGFIITNVIFSIRKNLSKSDITQCSKSTLEIPYSSQYKEWITFDLDDISLHDGQTYYLVCKTRSGNNRYAHYAWMASENDVYDKGKSWISYDLGNTWRSWEEIGNQGFDFCFKTYY